MDVAEAEQYCSHQANTVCAHNVRGHQKVLPRPSFRTTKQCTEALELQHLCLGSEFKTRLITVLSIQIPKDHCNARRFFLNGALCIPERGPTRCPSRHLGRLAIGL